MPKRTGSISKHFEMIVPLKSIDVHFRYTFFVSYSYFLIDSGTLRQSKMN